MPDSIISESPRRSQMTPRVTAPSRSFPQDARLLIEQGQTDDAIELCRQGLLFFPDEISGYVALAEGFLDLSLFDQARRVLRDGARRTGVDLLEELAGMIGAEPEVGAESDELPLDEEPVVDVEAVREIESTDEPSQDPQPIIDDRVEMVRTLDDGFVVGDDEPDEVRLIEEDRDWSEQPEVPFFVESTGMTGTDLFTGEPVEPAEPEDFRPDDEKEPTQESESQSRPEPESRIDLTPDLNDIIPHDDAYPFIAPRDRGVDDDDLIPAVSHDSFLVDDEGDEEAEAEVQEGVGSGAVESDRTESNLGEPDVTTLSEETGPEESKPAASLIDGEIEQEESDDQPISPLSLRSGTRISRPRSNNLRLIPGLEFAPLRKDDATRGIGSLVDERAEESEQDTDQTPERPESTTPRVRKARREMPPLGPEELLDETVRAGSGASVDTVGEGAGDDPLMTPLEELARRLENARIPSAAAAEEIDEDTPAFEPTLVSDTFAKILVSQGAYGEAIKAYRTLARKRPDQRERYEKKIAELEWKMKG